MNVYFFHDLKIFSLPFSLFAVDMGVRVKGALAGGDRRELPLALKVQAFRIGKTRTRFRIWRRGVARGCPGITCLRYQSYHCLPPSLLSFLLYW